MSMQTNGNILQLIVIYMWDGSDGWLAGRMGVLRRTARSRTSSRPPKRQHRQIGKCSSRGSQSVSRLSIRVVYAGRHRSGWLKLMTPPPPPSSLSSAVFYHMCVATCREWTTLCDGQVLTPSTSTGTTSTAEGRICVINNEM